MSMTLFRLIKPLLKRNAINFLNIENVQAKSEALIRKKLGKLGSCNIGRSLGASSGAKIDDLPITGHTMGSVSLMYQSEHGSYLFTGDTIMEMPGTDPLDQSFTLSMFTAYNNWLMDQAPAYPEFMYWWQFSLGTLGSTVSYVDTICPGHDAPYDSAYALGYIEFTRAMLNSFSYPLMP